MGSNLSPFLIKQPYVGYTTSYYKPPFLHRAILCSLILAFDTQILGKRASRNKALNCIGYCWRGCRLQSAHTFLAFSIGIRFFGEPAFEFRLTDLVLLAFLLAFWRCVPFFFLTTVVQDSPLLAFLPRPWWAGFLVAVVSPVSALPVAVGTDCTWVCHGSNSGFKWMNLIGESTEVVL